MGVRKQSGFETTRNGDHQRIISLKLNTGASAGHCLWCRNAGSDVENVAAYFVERHSQVKDDSMSHVYEPDSDLWAVWAEEDAGLLSTCRTWSLVQDLTRTTMLSRCHRSCKYMTDVFRHMAICPQVNNKYRSVVGPCVRNAGYT